MARCGDRAQAWIKKGWSYQGKCTEKCTLIRYMYKSEWIIIWRSDWSGLSDRYLFGAFLNPPEPKHNSVSVLDLIFSMGLYGRCFGPFHAEQLPPYIWPKIPRDMEVMAFQRPKCWHYLVKLPIIWSNYQSRFEWRDAFGILFEWQDGPKKIPDHGQVVPPSMFLNRVVGYGRWPSARGAMNFLVDIIGLVTSYNSWFGKGSDRVATTRRA